MEKKQTLQEYFVLLPLLWVSLSFCLGVVSARYLSFTFATYVWLALWGGAGLVLAWRRLPQLARLAVGATIVFSLGGARYHAAIPDINPEEIAYYNDIDHPVLVRGVLEQPPVYRDAYVELRVQVQEVILSESPIPVRGVVLARATLGVEWHVGQRIELQGNPRTPTNSSEFAYADYLARNGIYSEMPYAQANALEGAGGNWFIRQLYRLRGHSVSILHKLYADPAASLLAGILLGDESGIPSNLKEDFNITATRHIVAISGFNITIIAALAMRLSLRWLGARRGIWAAAAFVLAYTVLVGAQASVLRAAIMALVVLGAQWAGRDQHSLNTLSFTAALMGLINPLILWDVGFQLSFAATLGLLTCSERLEAACFIWLERKLGPDWAARLRRPISEYILLTFTAQVFTLPLLLHYFGRLSLVAMPANVLILPLQPAIFTLGGLSLAIGSIVLGVGKLIALLVSPLTKLTIAIVEWCARPTWASYSMGEFDLSLVVICYLVLLVIIVPALRKKFLGLRPKPLLPATVLIAAVMGIWGLKFSMPDGHLRITLLDVQGEAILIQTPTGRNVLINGGPSAVNLSAELGKHLPAFASEIDWLIISGQRIEQINGLMAGVEKLDITRVAWANSWPLPRLKNLLSYFETKGFEPMEMSSGDVLDLGSGAILQVVAIGPRGASLLVTWGDFQALLPTGIDTEQIGTFIQHPLQGLDVLLLADSGYVPFNPPDWLNTMDASVLWLSADGEFSDDLAKATTNAIILQADQLGWLRVETDGQTMWLTTENSTPSVLIQP